MTSRLADARSVLLDALAPCCPAASTRTRPPPGRVAAPKVWIADHDGAPATIGSATTVTVARFAVWVVYDGAVHAQVAGLDDLISVRRRRGRGAPTASSTTAWRPATVPGVAADSTLRAAVVTATVTITARTLCRPTPIPTGA